MKGKSKLLILDDWYEEFEPGTYVEDSLEKTIIARSIEVFPEYYTIPFKKTIEYNGESKQPDLCLIKKDYSRWYVIEVELSNKQFTGHTESQIRVFSNGKYNASEISKYLVRKQPELNECDLKKLILKDDPGVLIMVNEYPEWAKEAKSYPRTGILVFGMFDHPDGIEAYRIDGEYPIIEIERSRCNFPKYPANMLIVSSPNLLNIDNGNEIIIVYGGRKTKWERFDEGLITYLIPKGLNPLNINKKYFLIKSDENDYYIKEN
ncbi:MAG: hypothetical protein RBR97_17135 [Bacteroidales bacterium]|nr:hypothetical protein [Bacteroidales bacterium]